MTMPLIQGAPLLINLFFVDVTESPPPAEHELLGPIEQFVVSNLPQNEQTQVTNLLATPLDTLFDQTWSSPDIQNLAQAAISQKIISAESTAHNIAVSLPQKGTLRADTSILTPQVLASLPPGTSGSMLLLRYSVPGITATFNTVPLMGLPDTSLFLSFDGEMELDMVVPSDPAQPLSLWPDGQVGFTGSNFQVSPTNWWTAFCMSVKAMVSMLEGNGFPNFNPPNSRDFVAVPGLGLPGPLSDGLAKAAQVGFTQMSVKINASPDKPAPQAGNTVEIDVTHPADPGPQVQNALVPAGPSFLPPQIGLTSPAVPAGGQVDVNGSSFPAGQATELVITWNDTTSGTVTSSEVRWGPTPSPGVPPAQPTDVKIDRTTHDNTFTATGLVPGTEYAFLVRDFDVDGFISTGWSVPASPQPPTPQPWDGIWTFLQTQSTDQVDLVLSYQNTDLGTATLQTDGTFGVQVTVPGSVPAGTYTVTAMLAGQAMAQAPITVLSPGAAVPAALQVIDPNSSLPFQGTATVVGGVPVNLRGLNFTPGPVNLWVDAVGGTSLGTATAFPTGIFTTAPDWPSGVIGAHEILAAAGSQQATTPVWAEGAIQ
jgi:hypothetical protein